MMQVIEVLPVATTSIAVHSWHSDNSWVWMDFIEVLRVWPYYNVDCDICCN